MKESDFTKATQMDRQNHIVSPSEQSKGKKFIFK